MRQRGRPRKHQWLSFKSLESDYSSEAQYLKWASANNTALQSVAATGCPRCRSQDLELRHDRKFKIIRFHCFECRYETSYKVRRPKPGSFEIVPIFNNGIQVAEKIVDFYHPATVRQRSDAVVLRATHNVESGRLNLGGEWCVNRKVGGLHNQKRYFLNLQEAMLICGWNKMQTEHENRLRKLEEDSIA